jgi:hypothetical protein
MHLFREGDADILQKSMVWNTIHILEYYPYNV